ncbi:MAG TPA: crossover junction endodeoxyribonuclease RuvC [Chitinophagaceae bacterium]|nr:crossover junction endodeoxyribonuclease RuvC [Chitinophagaceae bacterium]
MQKPFKIILGIDPGTLMMGYGIIEVYSNHKIQLKEMNVLKLSGKKDNHERLQLIHEKIICLIEEHRPNEFAIEAPFFGKNVQSMLKLGRAQGVAIAAAMSANLSVTEYSPKKVKQSITGNGNADKEQVWKMLQRILLIEKKPKHYDATDALAVAICHHFQNNNVVKSNGVKKKTYVKKTSWEEFIKQNPARLRL